MRRKTRRIPGWKWEGDAFVTQFSFPNSGSAFSNARRRYFLERGMLGPSSVVPPASDEEDRTPGGRLGGETVSGRVDWSELDNLTGTPNKL